MNIDEWVSRAVAFKREKQTMAASKALKRFQRFLGKEVAAALEIKQSGDKVYFEYHQRRFRVVMLGGWAEIEEDNKLPLPLRCICTSLEDFLLFLGDIK